VGADATTPGSSPWSRPASDKEADMVVSWTVSWTVLSWISHVVAALALVILTLLGVEVAFFLLAAAFMY
jgi:hypothetical protein